jgi:hypothetical protein
MKFYFLSTFLCLFLSFESFAQEGIIPNPDPIATDRPDQTEAAAIVPKGYVQMELGFGQINYPEGKSYIFPNALIKYGVNENFELRLIASYASIQDEGKSDINGFLPVALGCKVKFAEENGIWPKISLLGHMVLPGIVTDDVAIENLAPDLRFAFAHTISNVVSLGYNLGVFWDGTNPEPIYFYSLAPGFSFGNFGFYVEGYGFIPQGTDQEVRLLADGGVTYLVNNDLQLDVSYGHHLSNNIIEDYIAVGVSWRFKI